MNMKVFRYPKQEQWADILQRPVADTIQIEQSVRTIINTVRSGGDHALRGFTERFDGVKIDEFTVSESEFIDAESRVPDDLKSAIQTAKSNIEIFHDSQRDDIKKIETTPGVVCWRKSVAIEQVGLYDTAG